MNLNYLRKYAFQKAKEHLRLSEQIYDFYHLACSEVEEGGSETHEVQLAINDINELIEDETESNFVIKNKTSHLITFKYN